MPAGSVVSSFRAGESAAVNQAKATTERGAYREDVDSRRRDANLTFPPKRRPLRGNQRENALLHRPRHEPVHDHPLVRRRELRETPSRLRCWRIKPAIFAKEAPANACFNENTVSASPRDSSARIDEDPVVGGRGSHRVRIGAAERDPARPGNSTLPIA
jgi:hypothetical protein